MITYLGSLPVSSINIGLVAALPVLTAEITKLQADISGLIPAIAANIELGLDFPPLLLSYATNLALDLNAAEIAAQFLPSNMVTASLDANTDLLVELGLVEIQIALVEEILLSVTAGLNVAGISAWSYDGGAAAFGESLETATANGFGRTAALDEVQAVIIATEDPLAWAAFSEDVYTGTGAADLKYLGELAGEDTSFTLTGLAIRANILLDLLRALKVQIQVQIDVSLGLNLPDIGELIDFGLTIDLQAALEDMVNVVVDFQASIDGVQLQIDAILDLSARLSASLAFGGLAAWRYTGAASGLGRALRGAIANGVPNGRGATADVDGLVLCMTPTAAGTFGDIFLI